MKPQRASKRQGKGTRTLFPPCQRWWRLNNQTGSWRGDAIKAIGEICRIGVGKIKRTRKRHVGGDGNPLHEIGGGLQDVILIGRAGQLDLEAAIAERAGCSEI